MAINLIKTLTDEVDRSTHSILGEAIDYSKVTIGNNLKKRYGDTFKIDNTRDLNNIIDWLKKYDAKFDKHFSRSSEGKYSFIFPRVLITLESGTFAYLYEGNRFNNYYYRYRDNRDRNDRDDRDDFVSDRSIYIFGRHYKKYYTEMMGLINHKDDTDKDKTIDIFQISGTLDSSGGESLNCILTRSHKRDIDTLFYEPGVKESIVAHIDRFRANKYIYEDRNITFKTGILLYGEPGTGKSSLVKALANKYDYSIISIDMTSFDKLNVIEVTEAINQDKGSYIVLLEDIDTLYNLNRDDGKATLDEKKIINKMLQFLDSASSPSNVVFIATTNNIDVLDDAIKRDGRFDLKVAINPIDTNIARNMILNFGLNEDDCTEVLKEIDTNKVNQSKLQNMILNYFKENVLYERKIKED